VHFLTDANSLGLIFAVFMVLVLTAPIILIISVIRTERAQIAQLMSSGQECPATVKQFTGKAGTLVLLLLHKSTGDEVRQFQLYRTTDLPALQTAFAKDQQVIVRILPAIPYVLFRLPTSQTWLGQ
jgi:hypothetical protein